MADAEGAALNVLAPGRVRRLEGFGASCYADAYVVRPLHADEVAAALRAARDAGRQVVLRGMGRSYGDAALAPEQVALDLASLSQIEWADEAAGVVAAGAGATLNDLWRWCLPKGFWPPVVAGTSFISLGGALAMNVHGKNAWHAGPIGEHVTQIEVMRAGGVCEIWPPEHPGFHAVISGAGLIAAILRVWLRLRPVRSGWLDVTPASCRNWDDQFAAFEANHAHADYMVSWVDCFASGASAGRGLFHAATYASEGGLDPEAQLPTGRMMGLVPRDQAWRALRLLNHRPGMRLVNALKHRAGRRSAASHQETLGAFSFLLDSAPDWRRAYLPGGFVQFQSFVPADRALETFAAQVEMQQRDGLESFLGVLKRHRQDRFALSHGVDGYSLALDFKLTPSTRERVFALCGRMAELVLEAGGRFYLAKDATLTAGQWRASLGDRFEAFMAARDVFDPDRLFTSALATRLGLDGTPAG